MVTKPFFLQPRNGQVESWTGTKTEMLTKSYADGDADDDDEDDDDRIVSLDSYGKNGQHWGVGDGQLWKWSQRTQWW